jgi:hypothetical protein
MVFGLLDRLDARQTSRCYLPGMNASVIRNGDCKIDARHRVDVLSLAAWPKNNHGLPSVPVHLPPSERTYERLTVPQFY